MKLFRISSAAAFIVTLLFIIGSCSTGKQAEIQEIEATPTSDISSYKPISDWEQREFNKADRNVKPNEVRKNLEEYRDVTAAWAGIILEVETQELSDCYKVTLLLEHFYYDWIENFGPQKEIIFLSTQGEGKFRTKWLIKKCNNISSYKNDVGKMVIAYGMPQSVLQDDNGVTPLMFASLNGHLLPWWKRLHN